MVHSLCCAQLSYNHYMSSFSCFLHLNSWVKISLLENIWKHLEWLHKFQYMNILGCYLFPIASSFLILCHPENNHGWYPIHYFYVHRQQIQNELPVAFLWKDKRFKNSLMFTNVPDHMLCVLCGRVHCHTAPWGRSVTPNFQRREVWGQISRLPEVADSGGGGAGGGPVPKLKAFPFWHALMPVTPRPAEWIVTIVLSTKSHWVPRKR